MHVKEAKATHVQLCRPLTHNCGSGKGRGKSQEVYYEKIM